MSSRPLKRRAIYGPVNSKRLGRSLGVNLLPTDRKVCTFDCVYCHYGATETGPYNLPRPDSIVEELRHALQEKPQIDYITFAGHGEPTLHMDFLEIVERTVELRRELAPDAKIALLTNSTKLGRPDVARACRLMDAPICKLDAGSPETLKRVNRPRPNIFLEDIVRGISGIEGAIVQAMLIEGIDGNSGEKDVEDLVAIMNQIRPAFVQVYSIDFPLPDGSFKPVQNERLKEIAGLIRKGSGVEAGAFWEEK